MAIVENVNINPELVKNVDQDLQPTKKRIMGSVSYAASFMGGCVSIGTFSMGAGLIGELTVLQAVIAMTIGCLVIAVALAIIGECGHTYGIPFTVQLRSSFGFTGVKIPGVLRGLRLSYGSVIRAGSAQAPSTAVPAFCLDLTICRWYTDYLPSCRYCWRSRDLKESNGWRTFPVSSFS